MRVSVKTLKRQSKTTIKRSNGRAINHPYIWRKKSICGGDPVIRDTRFPVRSVVNYVLRQGMLPEELVEEFSFLTLAQVYDALSYYYDHRKEIDKEIEENTEEYWKTRLGDGKWQK